MPKHLLTAAFLAMDLSLKIQFKQGHTQRRYLNLVHDINNPIVLLHIVSPDIGYYDCNK